MNSQLEALVLPPQMFQDVFKEPLMIKLHQSE